MPDDSLTLTIRLHDPKAPVISPPADPKRPTHQEAASRAEWVTTKVSRQDLSLPQAEFIAKYLASMLGKLGKLAGE